MVATEMDRLYSHSLYFIGYKEPYDSAKNSGELVCKIDVDDIKHQLTNATLSPTKLKIFRMDYNNWKTLKPIQTPAGMYGDTHDPFSDHSDMGFEWFIVNMWRNVMS